MESQHSQASLFSGSEAASSLELFSQPLNNCDGVTASAPVSCPPCTDTLSQPPTDLVYACNQCQHYYCFTIV